jgi:peptide/nickel transport system permease protein
MSDMPPRAASAPAAATTKHMAAPANPKPPLNPALPPNQLNQHKPTPPNPKPLAPPAPPAPPLNPELPPDQPDQPDQPNQPNQPNQQNQPKPTPLLKPAPAAVPPKPAPPKPAPPKPAPPKPAPPKPTPARRLNRRTKTAVIAAAAFALLAAVYALGWAMGDAQLAADFSQKALPPSAAHPFGTDMLGRDMLTRTVKGLSVSLYVGAAASLFSSAIALAVGLIAGLGKPWVDHCANWLIDLTMGVPHLVLLILISIAAGRGLTGLLVGIVLTHWTGLARIIRGEGLQIRGKQYVAASRRLGKGAAFIMARHVMPHMLPQFFIGLVLQFPHAIMHESSLTFLGFGLPPEKPAIGIILSEAMRYLSAGMWWQAFFPGAALVAAVLLIDKLGECLKALLDPYSAQL